MSEQQKKQEPAKAEAAAAKTPEAQKVVSTDNSKNGYLEARRAERAKAKGAN